MTRLTARFFDLLPPLEEGHVRLFRGENDFKTAENIEQEERDRHDDALEKEALSSSGIKFPADVIPAGYYTRDFEGALGYAFIDGDKHGHLYFLDVPEDILKISKRPSAQALDVNDRKIESYV